MSGESELVNLADDLAWLDSMITAAPSDYPGLAGLHRRRAEIQEQILRTGSAPDLDRVTVPRDLLTSLVDDTDCWFDHHGDCQAHGFSLKSGETCPQADLKALLGAGKEGT